MQFLQGIVFILLAETLALVLATEWMLHKMKDDRKGGETHGRFES